MSNEEIQELVENLKNAARKLAIEADEYAFGDHGDVMKLDDAINAVLNITGI